VTDTQQPGIDRIIADFAFLDDWEERYRYIIELGRGL
jgi:cysteine desulfuration protein SufE